MRPSTRAQRVTFKEVFDRTPLYAGVSPRDGVSPMAFNNYDAEPGRADLTYRQFRKMIVVCFDCACIPWCGMWLAVETDGYVHS
jgi:hypothetical protein